MLKILKKLGLLKSESRIGTSGAARQEMRAAAQAARRRLEESGLLQVELDAQAEIRERARVQAHSTKDARAGAEIAA